MLFSKKHHPCQPITQLVIERQSLERVTTFKYLGVLFSHDGSWSAHITNVCNKARKVLGFLYRKYYHDSHTDTLLHLYKMLVCPLLEYATCVWDPYLRKNINNIEKVQAFALKICLKEWHINYEVLIETASIPTLEKRRQYLKQCQLYSIINGLSSYESLPTARASLCEYSLRIRSVTDRSLAQPFARTQLYLSLFSTISAIRLWNSLPQEVVTKESPQTFKRALMQTYVHYLTSDALQYITI